MTISITLSRKMLAGILLLALLFVFLMGGFQWVSAQSEGTLLNVCIKDSKIRVVNDPNECDKDKEMTSSLVTGEGLQDLEAENAALKSLVRRLHRNSAAVIDIDRGGFTSREEYTEVTYRLIICPEEDAVDGICTDNNSVLEWTITEADEGITIIKTSGDGDFDILIERLTNGDNDVVCREILSGISCSPERSFFKDFVGPISTDLAGYDLDQISLAVDFINIYHPQDGGTEYDLNGRLFFELAD